MSAQSDLPAVSVVMPTYQGARYLNETLSAVRAQNYPASVEIVAVDSESTDNTRDVLAKYGAHVTSISQQNFTHGYSRNVGVRKAQHPVIVFMSQDALPVGTHWLRGIAESLSDPTVGAMYVRQVSRPDATPLEIYFHETLYPPRSTRYQLSGDHAVSLDKIFFSNVCSAARREVCLQYPFDENLIMSEDQAFAKALLQAGYQTVYNADVQVVHSHHYDLKTLFRRNFDSAYSLRGISSDSGSHTMQQALSYISGEVRYVIAQRQLRWLAAIPPYEMTRIAGRLMGRYADALPMRWRTQLSLHRGFWTHKAAQGKAAQE